MKPMDLSSKAIKEKTKQLEQRSQQTNVQPVGKKPAQASRRVGGKVSAEKSIQDAFPRMKPPSAKRHKKDPDGNEIIDKFESEESFVELAANVSQDAKGGKGKPGPRRSRQERAKGDLEKAKLEKAQELEKMNTYPFINGEYVHQRLLNRANKAIGEKDPELKTLLQKFMKQGIDSTPQHDNWATKNRWVELELVPDFKDKLHRVMSREPEMVAHFEEFDGTDIVHQTMKYLLTVADKPVRNYEAYYEFLEKEFTPKRMVDFKDLERIAKELVKLDHAKAKKLLIDLYGFSRDAALHGKPAWRMLYLACRLGCIGDIGLVCYQKNGGEMPDLGHCRIDYDHPADRSQAKHEADLMWAIHHAYPALTITCLKGMFVNPQMFMYEPVLVKLNATSEGVSERIVHYVNAYVGGKSSIELDVDKLILAYRENAWLHKYILQLLPVDGVRFNMQQFTEFLTYMSQLDEHKLRELIQAHQCDTLKVYQALPAAVRLKTDANINAAQVSEEMKKLIDALPRTTRALYDEFEKIAKEEMTKDKLFQFQALQAYICAVMVDKQSKLTLGSVPSGSGKSHCIMLLAVYYQKKGKKVAVVTSSQLLVDQLKNVLEKHVDDLNVQYCIGVLVEKVAKNFVVLLDEADYIAKHFAIKVSNRALIQEKSPLKGIPSFFAADKVHAFTATATSELEAFWKNFEGWENDYKEEFKSESQLSSHLYQPFSIYKQVHQDDKNLLTQLYDDIKKTVQDKGQPVLVFTSDKQDAIQKELKKLYGNQEVGFYFIDSDKTALNVYMNYFRQTRGVFLVKEEYARGWDSKLEADAVVLVYDPKEAFSLSTVVQMAGRGNRRKGETAATYYSTAIAESTDVVEYLSRKEKDFCDHAEISKAFWNAWQSANESVKVSLSLFAEDYRADMRRKEVKKKMSAGYFILFPLERPSKQEEDLEDDLYS